ncbi:hypothetical protein [Desulfitobacterium hafniense]|nr:hypothetical protein [Desulfitobacterium hafniense]
MVLKVNHLTQKYGRHTAVDNISFSLEKGTITGLSAQTVQAKPSRLNA